MCEFCGHLLSYLTGIDACCCYCNVVAHMQCIDPSERLDATQEKWVCPECAFDMNENRNRFNEKRDAVVLNRNQELSGTVISAKWRGYLTRKRYVMFIRAIGHLQSIAKIIYRQHVFKEIRKMMLRPLKVHILNCSSVDLTNHVSRSTGTLVYIAMTVLTLTISITISICILYIGGLHTSDDCRCRRPTQERQVDLVFRNRVHW